MQENARLGKEILKVGAMSNPAHRPRLREQTQARRRAPSDGHRAGDESQDGPHGMCSFDKRSLGIISTGKNGQLFFRSREAKSPTAFFWSPQGTCFHSNHNLGRCCLRVNYPRKIFSVGYQSWMGRNSTESESRTSLGLTEVEEIGSAVARGGSCQRQSCTLPW